MIKRIAVLPGDGIGPEVTREALKVLTAAGKLSGLNFECNEFLAGGASLDACGEPITNEVLDNCKASDAVFLGAVGGPKWDTLPKDKRPEKGLLRLRKELGLFTNLRPVTLSPSLLHTSTIKPEFLEGVDILVVRELTGGIYFGEPKLLEKVNDEERAVDTMEYRTSEVERIARVAFDAARKRRNKVTSVDKANILVTSQLWRRVVENVAVDYSDVALDHMLVDNCAMQIVRNPQQFDVLLTGNMFGDILSDEASMLAGSLGMLASASLGIKTAMYEPAHGSAPDIAGKDMANPLAAINSIALMFRFSFDLDDIAKKIETAVQSVLNEGYRTVDIMSENCKKVATSKMGDLVVEKLEQ